MAEYATADLIGSVMEKDPEQFRAVFDDLMADKISAAIEIKRQDVAQKYFDTSDQETEIETEEQDGQDSETDA